MSAKSRRQFLRGAGVALALPWMESLPLMGAEPDTSAKKAVNKPPLRFATLYFSNGVEPIHWWAKGGGASMEIGPRRWKSSAAFVGSKEARISA